MEEQTEHKVDRTNWPAGPWDDEPDRMEWRDEKTGMPCLMVRNSMGAWCWYVGVPPGHRYHGVDYDSVDVSVHGGLTYGNKCGGAVCHVPRDGEPADVFWLGFDCCHWADTSPSEMRFDAAHGFAASPHKHYRDVAYVRAEVTRLAEQLA